MTDKQARIGAWLRRVFAEDTCKSIEERCLRVLEEVTELAQACGVDADVAHRVLDYVYQRPAGKPAQEIAGSMVTLYAVAWALDIDADAAFEAEYWRINRPEIVAKIQRRQAEKREALVAVATERASMPALFDCGCSRLKVGAGLCDIYDERGELRDPLEARCSTCDGTGQLATGFVHPDGRAEVAPCERCDGTGGTRIIATDVNMGDGRSWRGPFYKTGPK